MRPVVVAAVIFLLRVECAASALPESCALERHCTATLREGERRN